MSRVNRLALKLMNHRREAINKDIASQAMDKFDYKIPFKNLFGNNVYRTVVPLKSSMQKRIEYELGELKNPSGVKVFDGIDWAKGEAYKVVPPHEKAPPGTPPKVTRTNLGKALGRLPNAQTYLNWWSQNQGVRDENGFSIVISRHPLDVIRMSDFPGDEKEDYPEIESCHSPGGSYWSSCVTEMKHGGPIAYLVKNKDLDSLDPKQIAGRGEIFADRDRKVPGIQPLSRLRLRRFTHEDGDFDLAIPETKVYGNPSSDFKGQVVDWARTKQEDLIGGNRLRMREFTRRGGDYSDSKDSVLFNRFFQDELDRGDTEKGGDNKGQEAENDRRRNEIEQIHNTWDRQLSHCSVSYDEYGEDYGGEDEEIQFNWSGSMSVEIPKNMFVGMSFDPERRELTYGPGSLKNALSDKYFYADELSEDSYGDGVRIYFDIKDEDANGDPDGYNDFCSMISSDYDDKYDEVKKVIMDWLYGNGHIHASPARQFVEDFEAAIHQFQNFHVEWDDEGLMASAEASIGSDEVFYQGGGSKEKFTAAIKMEIRMFVINEINKIVARQKSNTGYLPGFEPEPLKRETYDTSLFNVEVFTKLRTGAMLRVIFEATDLTTQEKVSEIIDLLKIVDQMFPRIVNECQVWLQKYEQQLAKHNALTEEHKKKTDDPYGTFQFYPRKESRRRRKPTTQEIFAP